MREASKYAHTPSRTAKIWEKIFPLHIFYHLIRMTDNFFALYLCLCVNVSFILLLFHKQTPRNHYSGVKNKKMYSSLPPQNIFLHIFSWKCPAEPESAGNGIFETLNLKICLERLRRSNFSSSACTQWLFTISRYAPVDVKQKQCMKRYA